jgi:hypothetical protein
MRCPICKEDVKARSHAERWGPEFAHATCVAAYNAGKDDARESERQLRRLLAVRVGMPHTYYDDGEAQGQEHGITIDFMREPVADIDAKLRALNVARAAGA